MYMGILNKGISFPRPISPKAQDLITRLLCRNPEDRLGFGPKDATPIKSHPYFEGINWELLYNRGYRPPFKPALQGPADLSNFDSQFTKLGFPRSILEHPSNSNVSSTSFMTTASNRVSRDVFDGFNFDPLTSKISGAAAGDVVAGNTEAVEETACSEEYYMSCSASEEEEEDVEAEEEGDEEEVCGSMAHLSDYDERGIMEEIR